MHALSFACACGVAGLILATAGTATAQCPDGTPPPCARTAVPTPQLDAGRWAVFPFRAAAPRTDVALLRLGLHLMIGYEIARWRDLSVVEDAALAGHLERADISGGLKMPRARTIAERVGAATLVLGEVSRQGTGVRVTARAVSTRNGRVLREKSVSSALGDSVLTHAIAGITAALLDLTVDSVHPEPVAGTSLSTAYREFLRGRAVDRADQPAQAAAHYRSAVALDPTYALAQHAAFLATYDESRHEGETALAQAALRNTGGLPLRLRQKIAAAEALSRRATADACAMYRELLKADSTDRDVQRGVRWSCR